MSQAAIITGRGVVSPAGVGIEALWQAVASGTSQVRAETVLDLQGLPVASVSARFPGEALASVDQRWSSSRRSTSEALLWEVIDQALRECRADERPRKRTTLLTTELYESGFEESTRAASYGESLRESPATTQLLAHYRAHPPPPRSGVGSRLTADLAERLDTQLSLAALQCTCATSVRLLCEATRLIQLGRSERVIVAVLSRPVDAPHIAAFARALSLSRWDGVPAAASRPFDQQRSGFVFGEGAAALVLEPESSLSEPNVPALAKVLGWGLAMSYQHFMRPSLLHMVRVMRQALAASGVRPTQIDLVDAMGASTQLGDADEARAIHRVFGSAVEGLRVIAQKSVLGYSSQAAGLLELVGCTQAMREGLVPPLPHCEQQEADLELPICRTAEPRAIGHVLKHAFGLGGQYAAVVLGRAGQTS
jgi:3-oxoacyl-[acyl-carrier-protein] synthase II